MKVMKVVGPFLPYGTSNFADRPLKFFEIARLMLGRLISDRPLSPVSTHF